MSRRLQSIFALRSSRQRGPDGIREQAQSPRTIRQIQQLMDARTIEDHFAEPVHDDQRAAENTSSASSSSHDAAQHGSHSSSSSTHRLEHDLLMHQFKTAHAEVGYQSRELRDMVLQVHIIENGVLPELQNAYTQLVVESTKRFKAIACKMARLRTQIDLKSTVTGRMERQPQGERVHPQTSHRESASTQQAKSSRPRAGDQTLYCVNCRNFSAKSTLANSGSASSSAEGNSQPSSITPLPSCPGCPLCGIVSRNLAVPERHSEPPPATSNGQVHPPFSFRSEHSFTDIPVASNSDDLESLVGIPKTFSDLPVPDTESPRPSLE